MLAISILAAGKGTRMKSTLPKVLQPLLETPLIEWVLNSCKELKVDRFLIVVGHKQEEVKKQLSWNNKLEFITQNPQNGTGHAVQTLVPSLGEYDGDLLVLNGDVPLLKPQTISHLVEEHQKRKSNVTIITSRVSHPKGYGRVFAQEDGLVDEIIEDKDCTKDQLKNNLVNAGIYCFNWKKLKKVLPLLNSDNNQQELYLTDAIKMIGNAMHIEVKDEKQIRGINNRIQLAECEKIIQNELKETYMNQGVTFIAPDSCTVSNKCKFGSDVIIEPETHLRGECVIGNDSIIGPGCYIKDSKIGDNVKIIYSVINESTISNSVEIGPFANIRPMTYIEDKCKVGNFVEIKKSIIQSKSKINHLSYIGDANIGKAVNIGAGTITANYDGKQKHQTLIGNNSKTGANSVLVAPINIGENVTIGAGSTLTKNVPNNSLAIGRAKQFIKNNWIT